MGKNNNGNIQEQVDNVFTYGLFWWAVLLPIIISIIFLFHISYIAHLTFNLSSFKYFELFLTHMHFPLLIASLALPFGTVAASNFRSIQFQKSLNIQQAVMVQGKEDFVRSMYLKELEYFKGKFKAIVKHGEFKLITEDDGHLIYARIYELSLENGDYPFKKNMNLFQSIADYFTHLENTLLLIDEDAKKNSDINPNIKLLKLMNWLVKYTIDISHALGVRTIQRSDSLKVMRDLVNEVYGICMSLYQDENIKEEPIQKILHGIQRLYKASSMLAIDSTTIQGLEVDERIKENLKHSDIRKQSNHQLNSYTFNLHI
jgi:hypothetical protein